MHTCKLYVIPQIVIDRILLYSRTLENHPMLFHTSNEHDKIYWQFLYSSMFGIFSSRHQKEKKNAKYLFWGHSELKWPLHNLKNMMTRHVAIYLIDIKIEAIWCYILLSTGSFSFHYCSIYNAWSTIYMLKINCKL